MSKATLNPFEALESIKDAYRSYVNSFQEFKNPAIQEWVDDMIKDNNLLYKGPFLQLNRRFLTGDSFDTLEGEGLIHPKTPQYFSEAKEHLFKHQSEAIHSIMSGKNAVISTGTGSGKSFCFEIPIISTCLEMQDKGIDGVKAIIVYPMNALANSQYSDLAARLGDDSGLHIAKYTADTKYTRDEAEMVRKDKIYKCELISREEIKATPPDILITNYVMLEYILTRFEDRTLFPLEHKEVLQYLVFDEVHTYTGKKGADVAYLVRRLKQRTATDTKLRCIGTSATVQDDSGLDASKVISNFATDLFGEEFLEENVIRENYIPLAHDHDRKLPVDVLISWDMIENFDNSDEKLLEIVEALLGDKLSIENPSREFMGESLNKQVTIQFIENELSKKIMSMDNLIDDYQKNVRNTSNRDECEREVTGALMAGMFSKMTFDGDSKPRIVPKVHTFFSQGREIKSCLTKKGPHLNDAGEIVCPKCAKNNKEHQTFSLVFCRSCGQEYYSVEILDDNTLISHDLEDDSHGHEGIRAYIYPGRIDTNIKDAPDNWIKTNKSGEKIKPERLEHFDLKHAIYCPICNMLYYESDGKPDCMHPEIDQIEVTIVPYPFLYCPSVDEKGNICGVHYDKTQRSEFNKLFSFNTVGRSTATDVIISNTIFNLPKGQRKVIAFSDNRQDTALQAGHINHIQKRIAFRRALYRAVKNKGAIPFGKMGEEIYRTMDSNDVLPDFSTTEPGSMVYTGISSNDFERYLQFNVVQEISGDVQKNQPNLEDVGLLKVDYHNLDSVASRKELWDHCLHVSMLTSEQREEYIRGILDIMRLDKAIKYNDIAEFRRFKTDVVNKLNQEVLFHVEGYNVKPVGYNDTANELEKLKWTSGFGLKRMAKTANGKLFKWSKRVLGITNNDDIKEALKETVEILRSQGAILQHNLVNYQGREVGHALVLNPSIIMFKIPDQSSFRVCKKCNRVNHFNHLEFCICPSGMDFKEGKVFDKNYFYREYTRDFADVLPIHAEEHSAQIDGDTRKDIEDRFHDSDEDINVIVCTPTMELGIDIGDLSSVYMRNVPPSPSNYAQRAGRAGRQSQNSIINTFCGVGSKRGPHDQYFYRFPEKIIAGEITSPRFLLDNKALVETHIHSIILETIEMKIPGAMQEIIDFDKETMPLYDNLIDEITSNIDDNFHIILSSIKNALSLEIKKFEWLDDEYIKECIFSFIEDFDFAFDRVRREYSELMKEYNDIFDLKRTEKDPVEYKKLSNREAAIHKRLIDIKEGNESYETHRYLSEHGFIPNYGFPTHNADLSLLYNDSESTHLIKLSRDEKIAINEYAPGNVVYYSGGKYTIRSARIPREGKHLKGSRIKICDHCETLYLDEGGVVDTGACKICGADISDVLTYSNAITLPFQTGFRREAINSAEEERYRLGYDIKKHYRPGPNILNYCIKDGEQILLHMAYDHDAKVYLINHGPISRDEGKAKRGFAYCTACERWLTDEKDIKEHQEGKSKRKKHAGCRKKDVVENIVLYTVGTHDVITLHYPSPEGISEYDKFYKTFAEAIIQSLHIYMNVDEDELAYFLKPHPSAEEEKIIVIYEMASGGAGIVKSVTEKGIFSEILEEALKIMHKYDPAEACCERACYRCLLNFRNQADHEKLDRNVIMPVIEHLKALDVLPCPALSMGADEGYFNDLLNECESGFEKIILKLISHNAIMLPDSAQYTIYRGSEPVTRTDFAYIDKRIAVFVDGPDHEKDYVKKGDSEKRKKVSLMGWQVVEIKYDDIKNGLQDLANRIGLDIKIKMPDTE